MSKTAVIYHSQDLGISKELSKEQWLDCIKKHSNYPKQYNEHNALADAVFVKTYIIF